MKNLKGIKFILEGSPNTKLKILHQEKRKMKPFYIHIQQNVKLGEKANSGMNFFVVFNLFIFGLSQLVK